VFPEPQEKVMRVIRFVPLLVLCLVVACAADPGRDVQPMAPPLAGAVPGPATTEVISMEQVRKSQAAAVSQRVANTEITLTYSRPVARGRVLFGGIVPYGQVWNPGADQATAVTFSRDVMVNGQSLTAGKYSLWSVPGADRWTMIFSRAADVYHTPYPGEAHDVLRLDITPEAAAHAEVMTFDFPLVEGKDAVLRFHWGTTSVPMTVTVP